MSTKKTILFLASYFAILAIAQSKITLPDIIGSNMVLQRDQSVPIWGTAGAGETILLAFNGQEKAAISDKTGKWTIWLDPMPANATPASMFLEGEDQNIELEHILVGEVWLCAGQSNMQWELQQSDGGKTAILEADYPNIRLFNASRDVAFKRKEGPLGSWQPCSPETVLTFSGVGYFFALDLYKELGIPVGMINSSYGGSQAEAWTPRSYLAASPELLPCIEREKTWEAERPQVQKDFDHRLKTWEIDVARAKAGGTKAPNRPRVPDALRDYRIAASIYRGMIEPLIPYAIKGALWYQGESNEERAEQYELLLTTMI
ncbi:MAG: hypothetical protein KDC44_02620, partial [Phaeodactylibacter sp.]|nr:hypothetical protein [Phaeodactylibacter sp.]